MYTHPLSISRVLQKKRSETAAPQQRSFFRGLLFALLFSLPLWGLIIWAVWELFR